MFVLNRSWKWLCWNCLNTVKALRNRGKIAKVAWYVFWGRKEPFLFWRGTGAALQGGKDRESFNCWFGAASKCLGCAGDLSAPSPDVLGIPNTQSWIPNTQSWIADIKSWIPNPKPWIPNPKPQILNTKPKSQIPNSKPRILNPGSWIPNPYPKPHTPNPKATSHPKTSV